MYICQHYKSLSSLTFSVTRTQSAKDYTLFTALRQCWRCQTTSGYMTVLFISIDPLSGPTLDNADPLFVLVIILGFYLYHVEVADQSPASGSL